MKQTSLNLACECSKEVTQCPELDNSFIQAISVAHLQVRYYSEALPTQPGYCAGVSRLSATGNCELRTCQGPYVAARAGFEPTTLR